MFTHSFISNAKLQLKRLVVTAVTVGLLISSCATPAFAWNGFGHMTVGYIAWQRLTEKTKTRLSALLRLNDYYSRWEANCPEDASQSDKDMMIFMQACTWADQIKGDKSYTPDVVDADGDRDLVQRELTMQSNSQQKRAQPSLSQRMITRDKDLVHHMHARFVPFDDTIGYANKSMHKTWHYFDWGYAQDGTAVKETPTPNLQTQIAELRKVLSSNANDDAKSYAAVWIGHLVGDAGQPMHCITRVSSDDPDGDRGGNMVKLHGDHGKLHTFTDDVMGTSNRPEAVVEFAKTLAQPDESLAANTDERNMIAESHQAAIDYGYVDPIKDGDGPFTLTPEYRSAFKAIAEERVALQGARLANIYNNELK